MIILGIETSCDETAISVIDVEGPPKRPRVKILSNVVASQVKLHAKFGGVVPHLAKREHQKNLVPVLRSALSQAGLWKVGRETKGKRRKTTAADPPPQSTTHHLQSILSREPDLFARIREQVLPFAPPRLDTIAVTVGPGLAPALWVGVNFARALSFLWGKPLIAVNHLEGHIYTNLLPKNLPSADYFPVSLLHFPALCLIVSGGHTEFVLVPRLGKYRVIGETHDDAAGEAFDKVAKMMHLGFPGGPVISRLAELGNIRAFNFPRPMFNSRDYDFSFSGLKTAVLYTLRDLGKITSKQRNDISASFEQAVVDVLVKKTVRAARDHRVRTVMIGGGVAANKKLRAELGAALKRAMSDALYLVPKISLTGDNALMIALAGYFNRKRKVRWKSLRAEANLRLDARTPH